MSRRPRGGDVEPRDRAAQAVTPGSARAPWHGSSPPASRSSAWPSPSRRASSSRTPRPTWRSPLRCSSDGPSTCGTRSRAVGSCRTRPMATSGRWARSSGSDRVLHVPAWAVQRLWLALVMCVAFLGAALLARALGVRSDVAIILGGRRLRALPADAHRAGRHLDRGVAGRPGAVGAAATGASGSTRGSPRRAAALSAVAVAMVGGVNAAATFSVIPLGRDLAAHPRGRAHVDGS